jgi:D-arabinose 1-dehydrogenase-like Zn-dependent alcohol dehydrogenase
MRITKINAYAVKHMAGRAEPFAYEKRLGDSDVLVRITHSSIARGDVQFIDNDWGDTKFPLVPGHEIVGLIEESGSAVTDLMVGDRVGVGYQQAACFACEFCRRESEQLCREQKVIGVDCYGGAAEHIGVDHRFVFKLPPALDSTTSTPLLSSGLTVYSAIVRASLPDRSEVAVLGVGGLGHLAIQFLRKMGHRVSAFSHSPEKKASIERLGASYVDSSNLDAPNELSRKFDLILSTVNASFDLNAVLRMLRPLGKLCFVAQPLKPLPISIGLLYDVAQRTVYGNYVGSRSDMAAMLAFAAEHDIGSAVHTIPFSNVNEAIDMVRNRTDSVRVVLQRT